MTIVFSGVLPRRLIVMTVDSAVTNYFETHREYDTGRKAYRFPGVGCVATWGARDTMLGRFFDKQNINAAQHSIDDLADLVERYLKQEFQPAKHNLEDVGYHVAGFDAEGDAHFFHIFWGVDRPGLGEPKVQKYSRKEEPIPRGKIGLFYGGRNDLAETVVRALIREVVEGRATRFRISTPVGLACFSDFVARFAAELTPEVGPPFFTYLISLNNGIKQIENDNLCPISSERVIQGLTDLGYTNLIR